MPPAAHPPIRYVRLSSSGRADPSVLIEEAHKAVDDACSTCARLEAVNGRSFIKILLVSNSEFEHGFKKFYPSAALCLAQGLASCHQPSTVPCMGLCQQLMV